MFYSKDRKKKYTRFWVRPRCITYEIYHGGVHVGYWVLMDDDDRKFEYMPGTQGWDNMIAFVERNENNRRLTIIAR